MPDIAAIHAAGVKAVQDYYEDSCPFFTWNGNNYKILPGSVILRKNLESGGFSLDSDLAFIAHMEQFAGQFPALKAEISYRDKLYRIQAIHAFPGELLSRYECNDASQAA